MFQGSRMVKVEAPVREGIGGHVQYSHHGTHILESNGVTGGARGRSTMIISQLRFLSMNLIASRWVDMPSRKIPRTADVMVMAPGLVAPRIDMHRC